jgi:hypothetical protein
MWLSEYDDGPRQKKRTPPYWGGVVTRGVKQLF